MWVPRVLHERIAAKVRPGKVFALYGPRRTGKTSVIRQYLDQQGGRIFRGTGDDVQLRDLIASQNLSLLSASFANYDFIFIDEAQRIPQVGWGLKLLTDHLPGLRIIVTGSSSFELSGQIGEPLTGRMSTAMLYPIAVMELAQLQGNMSVTQRLHELLVYGSYPEVLTAPSFDEKRESLIELRNAYLLKDILELENVKSASKLTDLLKLIAFQIGQEVSLNELSNALGIAKQTVERYLDLLEKAFVIKKISGYSRNLQKEVSQTARYYFLDNGVRNSLINNFNPPDSRNDMGLLWENFGVMERLKKQEYHRLFSNNYFWRTYDRQEIDLIEDRDGKLHGFEFKWNGKKLPKVPKVWAEAYPEGVFEVIHPGNLLSWFL